MAKRNPQPRRRKRSSQPPSIAVGGGEGFSIEIVDSLLVDGDPPPPPGEAGIANDFHNSSVNNGKSVEKDVRSGKLNGVEKDVRSGKLNGVENFSHTCGELGQGFSQPAAQPGDEGPFPAPVDNPAGGFPRPASTVGNSPSEETAPQFFSRYSKLLPQEGGFTAIPYATYPQCRPHPFDVVCSVQKLLKSRGVVGTRELMVRYPLEIILDAINSVDDMIAQGVEVRNTPKLILWRLRRIYANGESES